MSNHVDTIKRVYRDFIEKSIILIMLDLSSVSYRIKSDENLFNGYSIFIISILFHSITIFQGIDITDLGFHLTNQISATLIPVDIESIWPAVFLTDFVGGMWLKLFNEPSVLWARMGCVLVFSLNAAIIFSILSTYFDRKRVFIVVLISSLFVTMRVGVYIIDYFTFPAFLMNIELWLFNSLLQSTKFTKGFYLSSFMLGFMMIPIILSRISLIFIFAIPSVILAYYFLAKKDLSGFRCTSILAIVGLSCSALFFVAFYWHVGLLENFSSAISVIASDSASGSDKYHGMNFLFRSIARDSILAICYASCLLLVFYMISTFGQRFGEEIAWRLVIFLILVAIPFLFMTGLSIDFFARMTLKAAIGIVIFLAGLFLITNRGEDRNITLLLLAGVTTMVITPIGSDTGLLKSFYGMWLILPLAILCTYQIRDHIKYKKSSSLLSSLNCLLAVMLVVSLFFHATNIYRDNQNRLELNTEFSNPGLHGIYSTYDRVETLDEVLSQIKKNTNKSDKILAVTGIPLIYYLTETRPALGYSWPGIYPLEKIINRQRIIEKQRVYPKLFIFAKVDTGDPDWPKTNKIGDEEDRQFQDKQILEYLKNEYINRLNYSLIWENRAFVIYMR